MRKFFILNLLLVLCFVNAAQSEEFEANDAEESSPKSAEPVIAEQGGEWPLPAGDYKKNCFGCWCHYYPQPGEYDENGFLNVGGTLYCAYCQDADGHRVDHLAIGTAGNICATEKNVVFENGLLVEK